MLSSSMEARTRTSASSIFRPVLIQIVFSSIREHRRTGSDCSSTPRIFQIFPSLVRKRWESSEASETEAPRNSITFVSVDGFCAWKERKPVSYSWSMITGFHWNHMAALVSLKRHSNRWDTISQGRQKTMGRLRRCCYWFPIGGSRSKRYGEMKEPPSGRGRKR